MDKSRQADDEGAWRRLYHAVRRVLGREPTSRNDLLEIITEAQQRGLLDQDALDTIQRVLQVAELQVRDVMIPRSLDRLVLRLDGVRKEHDPCSPGRPVASAMAVPGYSPKI